MVANKTSPIAAMDGSAEQCSTAASVYMMAPRAHMGPWAGRGIYAAAQSHALEAVAVGEHHKT